MSGTALFEHMRAQAPHINVLFCSGYSAEERVLPLVARGEVEFIQKPFDQAALARKLRAVLDRTSDGKPSG